MIYGRVLPGVEASNLQLFLGIAVLRGDQLRDRALGGRARLRRGIPPRSRSPSSSRSTSCWSLLADLLLSRGADDLPLVDTLFFVFLFSILTMLYDRYRPVNEYRTDTARDEVTP